MSTGPDSSHDLDVSDADVVGATRPIAESEMLAEFADLARPTVTIATGQSLGRYVILRMLAAGGMSVVYVAFDPELNREVALKVMRPGGPEGDALSSDRLLREAQAMARLSHVNVVHVYDVGVVDQRVYMAMEYIRGDTLEQWLRATPRPWPEVVDVLVRAGRGLAAAHAAGLVHLDFKPRNVLVGDDGEVRVVDFGLARPPRSVDSVAPGVPAPPPEEVAPDRPSNSGRLIEPITRYGTIMGTPGYMAAEQLAAEGADARSDQFAFCVTAWVALYGERPFEGQTSRELNHAVLSGTVKPPSSSRGVPPRLRRLLERGLRNEPNERHASLDVLLDSLEADRRGTILRVAVGLGLLGLFGAAGYGLARTDNAGPTCDGGAVLVDGVWDDNRRLAVQAAILADPRPFATEVSDNVTRALDRWTARWREMHRDSCEATYVRGEQSNELLDLRTRCLRRRLGEVRALTDTLLVADATTVEHATQAVEALASVDACADVDQLTRTIRPADPAQEAKVETIYDRVALAVATQLAGNYPVALVYALEALLAAEVLGHAPLMAAARNTVGGLLTEIGAIAEAQGMLMEALLVAEQAGLDEHRLSILTDLVFLLGTHAGQPERAHRQARLAQALAVRVDAGLSQRSRVLANEAAVYGVEGLPHESVDGFAKALAMVEQIPEPTASNRASIHLGLGAGYHLMADYAQAVQHYERARDLLAAELGTRHPEIATAYENIGTAYQAMGRFQDAKAQFSIARRIYDEALVSEANQSSLLVGLAAAHEGLEEYEEAATLFRRVIQNLTAQGREVPSLAVAMGNLAGIDVELGRNEDALAIFDEQLPMFERVAGPDHVYVHYFRVVQARAALGLGRFVEAVMIAARVLEVYEAREAGIDPVHRGEARLVLARSLDGLVQAGQPLPATARAIAEARSIDAWVAAARVDLERAGVPGERPLRRLAAFEEARRKRNKADPTPAP